MSEISRHIYFREALMQPLHAYVHMADADEPASADVAMTKVLIDYKRGRVRQARLRFENLVSTTDLRQGVSLVRQTEALTPELAPMLLLDLLFVLTDAHDGRYGSVNTFLDAVECFAPDDHVCIGALYNCLIPHALRQADFAGARQLARLALTEYQSANCAYLEAYIHYHLALIHLCSGAMDEARQNLQDAQDRFAAAPDADCQIAMVALTTAWLEAEQSGEFPETAWLHTQKDQVFAGEFWAEPFLIIAALLFRTAVARGDDKVLEVHSELETVLRARGVTSLLPAMTLLRREFLRARTAQTMDAERLALPCWQLIWLMPTAATISLNAGSQADDMPVPRVRAAVDLMQGGDALARRDFSAAAPRFLDSLHAIDTYGWVGLLNSSRAEIEVFLAECKSRRRFVEQARALRQRLFAFPHAAKVLERPNGLTATEFAVIGLLPEATSNKAMARMLNVTEATIKFHLGNVYRKLGVSKRREAVKESIARGWVAPPSDHSGV